ncbi:hypothetical protein, partial [Peribacillus frigoritolerans]|uniref:hypothetical protein n=1 Tax=Peribacillus frigoritolerans TaxID=450367 RepID=UPI001E5C5A03
SVAKREAITVVSFFVRLPLHHSKKVNRWDISLWWTYSMEVQKYNLEDRVKYPCFFYKGE